METNGLEKAAWPTQSKHLRVHVRVEVNPGQPVFRALNGIEYGCVIAVEYHAKCRYHGAVPAVHPRGTHLEKS